MRFMLGIMQRCAEVHRIMQMCVEGCMEVCRGAQRCAEKLNII